MGHNSTFNVNSLTPPQKKRLKGAIREMNDCFTRIAAENQLIKDSIGDLSEELGLDKKLIRKLAKTYYKASFSMDKEENRTFEEFYSMLMETSEPASQ